MKTSILAVFVLGSTTSSACVGFSVEKCQALKSTAADMREEAKTGIASGDTQWSANLECGGHVPYDQSTEVLTEYWDKCAEHYDQAYKENCDLP